DRLHLQREGPGNPGAPRGDRLASRGRRSPGGHPSVRSRSRQDQGPAGGLGEPDRRDAQQVPRGIPQHLRAVGERRGRRPDPNGRMAAMRVRSEGFVQGSVSWITCLVILAPILVILSWALLEKEMGQAAEFTLSNFETAFGN